MVIQVYAPTTLIPKKLKLTGSMKTYQELLELMQKKDVLFIIGNWNAKVGSQKIPEVTGKFGLGVQNEAGQWLTRVLSRKYTGHSKHPFSKNPRVSCKEYNQSDFGTDHLVIFMCRAHSWVLGKRVFAMTSVFS